MFNTKYFSFDMLKNGNIAHWGWFIDIETDKNFNWLNPKYNNITQPQFVSTPYITSTKSINSFKSMTNLHELPENIKINKQTNHHEKIESLYNFVYKNVDFDCCFHTFCILGIIGMFLN